MQKRVKALNERREQLKAGIVSNAPKRRAQLVRKNEHVEWMRGLLGRLQVLQESQISVVQQRLAQAGIRKKEYAVAVAIILRAWMICPIVHRRLLMAAIMIYWCELFSDLWPDYKKLRRVRGAAVVHRLQIARHLCRPYPGRQTHARKMRKGLPDALDLLVICAEAGLTVDAAFAIAWRANWAGPIPNWATNSRMTAIELSFLTDRRQRV